MPHRHQRDDAEEGAATRTQTARYRSARNGPTSAGPVGGFENITLPSSTAEFIGQGRITGRAIYAIGKYVLHGVGLVGRLASLVRICAYFPHEDNLRISNVDRMYEELLELSCRDTYGDLYRKHALLALWKQIASGRTIHLVEALSRWSRAQTSTLLHELMRCLGPKWTQIKARSTAPPKSMHTDLGEAYFAMTFYSHPFLPLVEFIARLASRVPTSTPGILSSGFLDLLLNLYIQSFLTTSKSDPRTTAHRCSALFAACNTALTNILLSAKRCGDVALRADMLQTLNQHPLHKLWPRKATMPLSSCIQKQMLDRREAWNALGQVVVLRRLDGIANVVAASHEGRCAYAGKSVLPVDFPSDGVVNTTTDVFDDFIDLIAFTREHIYGECVVRYAIEILNLHFFGISESLSPELSQVELVQIMRDWIMTNCSNFSTLDTLPLWSLDTQHINPIPLTAHIVHNLQLQHHLQNSSFSMRDKSTLYFAGVFSVVLDAYNHELSGNLPDSTHPSAQSPQPPPRAHARLLYHVRNRSADPFSSGDFFCASSRTRQSPVQSWFNPTDTSNHARMYEPFCATTPKTLYQPARRVAHISVPFAATHLAHVSPEMAEQLVPLLLAATDSFEVGRRGERQS